MIEKEECYRSAKKIPDEGKAKVTWGSTHNEILRSVRIDNIGGASLVSESDKKG